jgi:hypothetical protein
MSTWIIIFHLIFPLTGASEPVAAEAAAAAATAEAAAEAEAVRYRGLEQMFAKFAAEPE